MTLGLPTANVVVPPPVVSLPPAPANPATAPTINACGKLTALTLPGRSSNAGSITIAGQAYAIAAGASVSGVSSMGATVCLTANGGAAGLTSVMLSWPPAS